MLNQRFTVNIGKNFPGKSSGTVTGGNYSDSFSHFKTSFINLLAYSSQLAAKGG